MKKKLIVLLLRTFLWRVVLMWCASLRITKINRTGFDDAKKNGQRCVVAFWHGSMLIGWYLHRPASYADRMSALVSQSNDGEYLSTVLERWKYHLIRGSSHIGGKEAMQLMVDSVMDGYTLAITPDGPRGPRQELKMGAIRTAQRANVPLFLVGFASRKKKNLRSWDAFEIPAPWSKVTAVYSDPISVPAGLEGAALDTFKTSVQGRLNDLTRQAEAAL